MTSPNSFAPLLLLFQKIAPAAFFEQLAKEHDLPTRKGIYVLPMVVWLMMYQRLQPDGSLASAVLYLAQGGARQLYPPDSDKRIRDDKISAHTGGYCRARQRMPIPVASQVNDHMFEKLRGLLQQDRPDPQRPVFVIDGSTLQLQHERDLVESFPPGHNQHGENHWPVMQIVVFHDAESGLAARPSWGPMYGAQAVSEQALAEESLARLPTNAVVMGDGNFGIFAFAHAVQQSQRPMLLRLTASRAQKILGGGTLRKGTHRKVVWEASAWDRKAHPQLPAAARVEGWVIVCRNPSRPQEKLCLFTTQEFSAEEILDLYKLRWNVETDLRSLKRTVALHQIHSKNVPMVEKELLLAVSAYNLVRAVMALAARRAGLTPRDLSFSFVRAAVNAALPGLDQATTQAEYDQRMEMLLHYAAQGKLPNRSRKRSYPREVWGRGGSFPRRHSHRKEQTR